MSARIAPLAPPYPPELQAGFDAVMRGAPPLLLFRTVARNARVLQRMLAGGLLDRGSIPVRARELMILRTTARCGAEYEWGVHVAAYGAKSGWTLEELQATVHGAAHAACWSAAESALLHLADSLHTQADVNDALWAELVRHYGDEQLIELVMLAGLYHAVSYLTRSLRLPLEPGAPRFPTAA